MQELIEKLQSQHNLSAEQSHGILETIKHFIQEKFPMLKGAVDNLFTNSNTSGNGNATTSQVSNAENSSGFLDKISDVIPGAAGERIEDYTKKAAGKVTGFFEGNKNDY